VEVICRYSHCSCSVNSYTVKHAVFCTLKVQDRKLSVWMCNIQGGSNMTGTNCDLFTHK
jgi:hypothetical protein